MFFVQLSGIQADFVEEHTTSTHASEMLESETAQRLKAERELKDIQVSSVFCMDQKIFWTSNVKQRRNQSCVKLSCLQEEFSTFDLSVS